MRRSLKINNTRAIITKPTLTYDEVCYYAGFYPEDLPHVTWESAYEVGVLKPGQAIEPERNMKITVHEYSYE